MSDESSTLTVDDLEEGKRYRLSFDGVWRRNALWMEDEDGATPAFSRWFFDYASSIEKLPDPEPVWKLGTVVKVPGFQPYLLSLNGWVSTGEVFSSAIRAARITEAWKAGTLEVLYTP